MTLLTRSMSRHGDSGTNRKLIYDFLLVINTNLLLSCTVPEIQPSMGPKSLYLASALAFKLNPDGEVSLGRSPYFCGCQWMAKVSNGIETLPKISTG